MNLIDGQGKALATSGAEWPNTRESSSLQRALSDHMTMPEGIEAAVRIVDAYPNGGRDAGKGYLGALAAVVVSYPRQTATACADRVNGITRDCKFLPTVADLVAWCERKTEPLARAVEREGRVAAQLRERETNAAHDATRRLTYDELKAKYGDGQGGWGLGAERRNAWKPPSVDELRAAVGDEAWDNLPAADKDSWQQLR